MNNKEELEKKTGVKHFDICIQNPPYSQRHNNNPIHFQFVEKVLEIAEKQIVIMPSRILHTTSENYNPWKEKFDKTLLSAEELKSDVFEGTGMMDVAIYELSNNKNTDNIKIKTLSSDKWEEKSSLFDSTIHNTYEDGILKLLDNNGNIKLFNLKTGTSKKNINYVNDDRKKVANKTLPKYKDKYLLSVNIANGGMNGHYMSSNAGKIFYNDIEKVLNDWINRNVNAIKYIVFNSKLAAENCRDAMKRPLLRFALYRTQDDQSMNNKCYKYIADIDWEDNKVMTDEGILELCGCPKNKCKEYADYCKKIIDEVEKKTGVKHFDICLMNPPYDGNLHLKFLEKIIEVCNITINISASDRFTNINLENKLSTKLTKYIDSLEIISKEQANSQFGIISSSNLGIGVFKENAKGYEPKFNEVRKFIKLIRKEKSIRSSINFYNDSTRKYKYWCGVQGDYGYAKSWHYSLEDVFKGNPDAKMGFDTKEELDNFIKTSTTTWPYKLMYIVDDSAAVVAHLPFMKDYTRYYDDEYFYKYFNITDDERKIIEDFINKHYKPINRIKNDK